MVVERRTLWIGAGLLVVVVTAIALWAGGDNPTAASAPPRRPARAQPGAKGSAVDEGPVAVNLEALTGERGGPVDAGRNPFHFQQPRRTQVVDPEGPESGLRLTEPVGPPAPIVPAGPPPPPPIPLKLFGIAEQGGKKVAMLTDGRDPTPGVEGQIVFGQYRILKIGQESVEMAYVDGRGRQTIRLSGQ